MNTDILSSGLQEAIGQSPRFIELQEKVGAIAPINRPVLLTGERGTGKELAAARLHYLSKRWSGPFIRWNCAASPADLVESELFGHEAGAFTGALKRRPGRFEMSHGGTLFLDELGQMPLPVQEKLLRVIEYGVFERVGGNESLQVDVRIVAATNEDLETACEEGKFRADLLDRIACCVVQVPSLRERREDIPLLARYYIGRIAAELGQNTTPALDVETEAELLAHDWPGNIRELRNVVERAVIHAVGGKLARLELKPLGGQAKPAARENKAQTWQGALGELPLPVDLHDHLEEVRAILVKRALNAARHNQRRASALLGLRYDQFRTLYRRLHKETDSKQE
jgi:psp operon transcriptional activator